jgi:uncharacterized protein YkwD
MQPAAASDSLTQQIATIRARGCGDGPAPALQRHAALDNAASLISAGAKLRDATRDSGYRALRSAMLEVTGTSDAAIAGELAKRGCKDIADPAYRDFGLASRTGVTWIVLATPLEPPGASDASAVRARVLTLVNEARGSARRCGWKRFEAAPPLARSEALDRAALDHTRDMASRSRMEHAGSDGSTPAERATRAGYRWRRVGENVAAGQPTPEQAVAEWLESPRHCANLMDPAFTEMGIGFAADPGSAAAIYWAQVFGTPLP